MAGTETTTKKYIVKMQTMISFQGNLKSIV